MYKFLASAAIAALLGSTAVSHAAFIDVLPNAAHPQQVVEGLNEFNLIAVIGGAAQNLQTKWHFETSMWDNVAWSWVDGDNAYLNPTQYCDPQPSCTVSRVSFSYTRGDPNPNISPVFASNFAVATTLSIPFRVTVAGFNPGGGDGGGNPGVAPIPGAVMLLGSGLAGLVGVGAVRRRKAAQGSKNPVS